VTPYWDNGPVQLYQADARSIPLPDQSVHCVVTSPPYFGLRVYKDNDDRGIGLESTVEDYIGNLVDVFREVWRVLRDDGVAWLNLGDSYSSTGGEYAHGSYDKGTGRSDQQGPRFQGALSQGNRLGIPERVVLTLQADGWVWRDTIIWAKKSAMPESLAGWRWEQCRVKVDTSKRGAEAWGEHTGQGDHVNGQVDGSAQWTDCPGCPKCADNDGLVLRRGSWRTTQAHEYIYMLTKGMGYYADGEAVKTASSRGGDRQTFGGEKGRNYHPTPDDPNFRNGREQWGRTVLTPSTANRRSVWNDISPEPYGGSHFATFPSDLPRICIQASTSERGCCSECGSQWARVVDTGPQGTYNEDGNPQGINRSTMAWGDDHPSNNPRWHNTNSTLGWRPTCNHNAPAIPAIVLDPFSGTATTCRAAQKLGRRAVGVDISESYLEQAVRRLSAVTLPMGI
jgi:DNA modification methylase